MEDSWNHSRQIRRPNKNKWVCPFCLGGTNTMNSRGAPAHIRNKHGLSWKKEYLENPELLRYSLGVYSTQKHFILFKELFSDIEIRDNILSTQIINQFYSLIKSTRKALKENDYSRLQEINRMLPSNKNREKNK